MRLDCCQCLDFKDYSIVKRKANSPKIGMHHIGFLAILQICLYFPSEFGECRYVNNPRIMMAKWQKVKMYVFIKQK